VIIDGAVSADDSGNSQISQAFGAKIRLTTGSLSMCLVIGRSSPLPALNAVGGRILAELAPTKVIAVVNMMYFSQLKAHPDIISAGSISVDPQRFAQFQRLLGLKS
jgi:hypothetical protein